MCVSNVNCESYHPLQDIGLLQIILYHLQTDLMPELKRLLLYITSPVLTSFYLSIYFMPSHGFGLEINCYCNVSYDDHKSRFVSPL